MTQEQLLEIIKFIGLDIERISDFYKIVKISEILGIYNSREYTISMKFHDMINQVCWYITDLVCGTYYPAQALKNISDFSSYQADTWFDNGDKINTFHNFILELDYKTTSKREIVETIYSLHKSKFDSYFELSD